MAGLRFFAVGGICPVTNEFKALKMARPDDVAFLVGRLGQVQAHWHLVAENDLFDSALGLYRFNHGKAVMLYMLETQEDGTASVVVLTFGNLRSEHADVMVGRAIDRRQALLAARRSRHGA